MTKDLEGKIIAITGAASGIGLACAKRYLAGGATVVLVDRDEAALAKICAEAGPMAVPVVVDLLSPASINGMMPRHSGQNRASGCVPRQCRRLCRG